MQKRVHRPVLSEKTVETALDAMRTGRQLQEHPLQYFLSIQKRLNAPHQLSGTVALQVAIFDHLSDVITIQLGSLRAIHHIPPPDHAKLEGEFKQDFRQGDTELEAWSLLFHRFICVTRNLSMHELAGQVNQDERTLRRRQKRGINLLTRVLVGLEQHTREQEAYLRQRLALPATHPPVFFGNPSLLSTVEQIVTQSKPPRHLVLCGPAGIGKTTLALNVAHSLIETQTFDDLLWVDLTEHDRIATDIVSKIVQGLNLPEDSAASPRETLRGYLVAHLTLLIIDNAETLLEDSEQASQIFQILDAASVIMTSRITLPRRLLVHQITLPELTQDEAFHFLEYISAQEASSEKSPVDFDASWGKVGGNPLALILLQRAMNKLPADVALHGTSLDHLHHIYWNRLPAYSRGIWILPLFFTPDGVPYHTIPELVDWDEETIHRALGTLTEAGLLSPHWHNQEIHYGLHRVTRSFLIAYVQQNLELSDTEGALVYFERVLQRRIQQVIDSPQPKLAIDLLRLAETVGLPLSTRQCLTRSLAPQIMEAGLWWGWYERLVSLFPGVTAPDRQGWLNQMLGITSHRIGRLEEAETCLNTALTQVPENSFDYANTLAELAAIYRYEGRWEETSRFSQLALKTYNQLSDANGVQRCIHELGQLSLETGKPVQALTWLSRLGAWSARTWSIASQAYLLLEQFEDALQAAERALTLLPPQHSSQGRALAALGQIHSAMGDVDAAVEYLLLATEMLNQAKDALGYARACNNLAVAYLKQKQTLHTVPRHDVIRLLEQAYRIQKHSGDEIGLAVTRQNLIWLGRRVDSS
jgi:tetratricopeptide (TPR) repeat protein